MIRRITFKYSLKVWLTSVLVAPAIVMLIGFTWGASKSNFDITVVFPYYIFFTIFGGLFSIVTWVIFFISIWLIVSFLDKKIWKTLIFLSGLVLTITTFYLIDRDSIDFSSLDNILALMMCANIACISWGAFYYRLDVPVSNSIEVQDKEQ